MKNKFKVGQKVRFAKKSHFNEIVKVGEEGVIKYIDPCEHKKQRYAVEFDRPFFQFHNCSGYTEKERGWWCVEESLKPIANETIVIYRKDQEVIALDKTTGNKAIARCCPEDEFDFYYGAALALGRLIGEKKAEEKPKYFSGLVQCIKRDPLRCSVFYLTRGKLYEVKDGHIINDYGGRTIPYTSIEHMKNSLGWIFKEIKEVKRPAKVGEFVKVVLPNDLVMNEYQKGDILKIVNCNCVGDYYKNESGKYLYQCEYVVLEGYEDSDFAKKFGDEIKVGDTVEVVDSGKGYTQYAGWFDKYCPKYASRFAYGSSIAEGGPYEVLAKHPHENGRNMLYAIRAGEYSGVYLIGEDGIKKV